MALKLRLKPGEKCLINGALISNAKPRWALEILVHNRAVILREQDIMQPEQATTPARRAYYVLLTHFLDPTAGEESLARVREELLACVRHFARDLVVHEMLTSISASVATGNYYQALKLCKELINWEKDHHDLTSLSEDRSDRSVRSPA